MDNVQYLSQEEINKFIEDLDKDSDGCISYTEIEHKRDAVHDEIAPDAKPHNLHHDSREDHEWHDFLRNAMGSEKDAIPASDFAKIVKAWQIPSMEQAKKTEDEGDDYMKRLSIGRKLRAYWSIEGPKYMFPALVISMQLAFGIWQMVKYLTQMQYRYGRFPNPML